MTYTIDHDDIWPRDADHRYRLYAVRGDEREVLAAAPDMAGVGLAIGCIHKDQKEVGRRLADLGMIGVQDVLAGPRGEWIVLPYTRHDEPVTVGPKPRRMKG